MKMKTKIKTKTKIKMKKRSIIFCLATLACLMLILVSLPGCSGLRNLDSAFSWGLFDNKEIRLPIKAKRADIGNQACGNITFESKKDVDELYEILTKKTELEIQKFDSSLLIKQKAGEYTDHFCLYMGKNGRYIFSNMRWHLVTDVDAEGHKQIFIFLLPTHLIIDPLLVKGSPPMETSLLYPDVEYEIRGGIDEVEAFYRESGWYEMTREGDSLLISGYREPNDVFSDEAFDGSLVFDRGLYIKFTARDGKNFFSIALAPKQ